MNEALSMPVPQPVSETAAVIHLIERLARDPSIDIERLQRLIEMRDREKASAAETAYMAALADLQGEVRAVTKRGRIDIGRGKPQTYATLEDVIDTVQPVLFKHGFSVEFDVAYPAEGRMAITTVLNHREGHHRKTTIVLPFDTSGSKNTVQSHGSSLSYGRRYGLMARLNLATTGEDDDGRAGGAVTQTGYDLSDAPVSAEQLAAIQQALVQYGIGIEWLIGFLGKRGLNVERLEQIPARHCGSVLGAIAAKAKQ